MTLLFGVKKSKYLLSALGGVILATGLYNIHALGTVTEGGSMGLSLLLHHHFGISPAVSSPILNGIGYLLGIKMLGLSFVALSAASVASFSLTYALWELFPVLWPGIADHPLAAALLGAVFVGLGCGFCVRAGGAPTGDDATAMCLSKKFGLKIETVYLFSDMTVLLLSLTYIPPEKILWSLLTVIISGRIIGIVQRYGK